MKYRLLIACALVLHALSGCGRQPSSAVEDAVLAFYAARPSHRDVDRGLLSRELAALLAAANDAQDRDRARVKASEFPDDKPQLIEGDIFTSLYEGQDRARVEHVEFDGTRALARLAFENTGYDIAWTDRVALVDENGWKIDNVIYGREGAAQPDLRTLLATFTATVGE
jgi:hypothetical protein